jgi:hypothetical protein
MTTTQIIVLVVVVLVVLAALAAYMAAQKKRRSEELRSTFGPEYDRTVDTTGRRRDAERDLAARAEHRSSLDIRPLSTADRQAFAARWTATQADFVDRPAEAVKSADTLVSEVMHKRGYPVGDFDQQARDVSVDHAEVVHEYRAAHDISVLNDRQQATTEQLRQAMVHYRTLFSELLGDEDVAQAAPPVYPTDAGDRSHRNLPDHDLTDRDVAYLDHADGEPSGRHLGDRDAARGAGMHGADDRGMHSDSTTQQAEARFEANHDGPYDDAARTGTMSGGATDPGYATDEDRRTREGGLLANDREEKVVHVRRERLDDGPTDRNDRDLPPRT